VGDRSLPALADGVHGEELDRRVRETADAIRARLAVDAAVAGPHVAAVLGSGLGGVVELLDPEPRTTIGYGELPHVPASGVEGHAGELVAGTVGATPMIMLSGRAHPYEGYSQREATLLLRAVVSLGVETLVVTNAAGGLNPAFDPGDVMLITDHVNLSGDNPLLGPNLDRFGPRFPPMTDAYDPALLDAACAAGERTGVELRRGVYIMLAGGDAVGMSTAHEVIVARHAGVRVLGFSLITNKATDDVEAGATHEEVIEMGRIGAERLVRLLGDLLPRLA
jgi:purine-nucleoside phosphorylase